MTALLKMEHISKTFGKTQVLTDVNFEVKQGEVHALLGENGAGKSTLVKILGGIYKPNGGKIFINGDKKEFDKALDAQRAGVSIIHQELMLMKHLTVAENIYMGRPITTKLGFVDRKRQEEEAQKMIDSLEMNFKANMLLGDLTIAQQQMVEIIRAISFQANIIAMDEPTSSLSERETEKLFEMIENLKAKNIGIILISHRLSDIFLISDRITVLRDGEMVDTVNTSETDNDSLIRMMVGRDIKEYYSGYKRNYVESGNIMSVENLSDGRMVRDVSFELKRGEILGVSGLVGAGRSETMECIFGLRKRKKGTVILDGREVEFKNPKEAMNAGMGFVCEDRKQNGLFLGQSVRFNTTINILPQFISYLKVDKEKESSIVGEYGERMKIKMASKEQKVGYLSGGNQQKVLISRWLSSTTSVLLLDEPTRGVDVKTKEDIYHLIQTLTDEGLSIIFVSSELTELLNVCDRILVLSNGVSTGILSKKDFNQETIMKYMTKEFTA